MSNYVFPVENWGGLSYHVSPRSFGCPRGGGRLHAGCDLYAPVGSAVKAISDGKIVYAGHFYYNVFMVQVDHGEDLGTIVYGEISLAPGIAINQQVSQGAILGYVKQIVKPNGGAITPMCHMEWYGQTGNAAVIGTPSQFPLPYRRRYTPKNISQLLDQISNSSS